MPQVRALVVSAVDTIAATVVTVPDPGPGEVAVDLAFTAVSPGTEARAMKGLQQADAFPYVPGYSGAGRIAACGAGATLAIGTPVYCSGTQHLIGAKRLWGGHIARAVLPASSVVPLAADADLCAAAPAHLAAIAYHGVRLARPIPGERVLVVGLGPIGLLSALIHSSAGTRVLAVDRSHARVERARHLGLDAAVVTTTIPAASATAFPAGADIVVDATGHPRALAEAVLAARALTWGDDHAPGARLVIQGSYPAEVALPYHDVFMRELQVLVPRDCTPGDIRAVLDLVQRGLLPLGALVSQVADPADAAAVYAELRRPDTAWVTAAFRWDV